MNKEFKLISLNIGGKRFSTYYDALKKSSYFQKLIENKRGEQAFTIGEDDDHVFFIDRDGDVFKEIMHFLQSLEIRAETPEELEKLKIEATFFNFEELVMKVDQVIKDNNIGGTDEQFFLEYVETDLHHIVASSLDNLPSAKKRVILNKISYNNEYREVSACYICKAE